MEKKLSMDLEKIFKSGLIEENVSVVKDWIDQGGNLEERYKDRTILMAAVQSSNPSLSIVKLLLDNGANVNARDISGRTPLHHLAIGFSENETRLTIANLLIDMGANIHLKDKDGKTLLHLAISRIPIDVKNMFFNITSITGAVVDTFVEPMLERMANPNIQDINGETPIHYTLNMWTRPYCFIKLIHWGGSVFVKSHCGIAPLDLLLQPQYKDYKLCLMDYIRCVKLAGLVFDIELPNMDDDKDKNVYYQYKYKHINILAELERMKQDKIGNNTVYDVFVKYKNPTYVNNRQLDETIQTQKEYCIYRILLKVTFSKAKKRFSMLNRAIECFGVPLPVELKIMILSSLDTSDMQTVITAYTQA